MIKRKERVKALPKYINFIEEMDMILNKVREHKGKTIIEYLKEMKLRGAKSIKINTVIYPIRLYIQILEEDPKRKNKKVDYDFFEEIVLRK